MENDLELSAPFKCWVQKLTQAKGSDYNETLKPTFTVRTIKEFWRYYQHMQRPSRLKQNDDNIYLFKEGILPMWEAPENKGGGCLKIKLRKARSNRLWEDIQLAIIHPDNKYIDVINGLRLKIKDKEDEVEVWLPRTEQDDRRRIKDYIRRIVFVEDEAPNMHHKNWQQ